MPTTISVSKLNSLIKETLAIETFFNLVVEGEISNFKIHQTGNLYFALKDANAQISANMWSSYVSKLDFTPKDGDKVICNCSLSVYEKGGTYSLNVTKMFLSGIGDLFKKYQETLKYYDNLGYFDKIHKKPIPRFPKSIGLITSATGAVKEDFLRTINRRYPLVEIFLYPSIVQGPDCPLSVSKQILKANKDKICDILLVGRGGGSFEDLFGFNDPLVIEAIHNSTIPIITCIGHAVDRSISDLVSDLEAPTPTAAAELATPDIINLFANIQKIKNELSTSISNMIDNKSLDLKRQIDLLFALSPIKKVDNYQTKSKVLFDFLHQYFIKNLTYKETLVNKFSLSLVSPLNKIQSYIALNMNYGTQISTCIEQHLQKKESYLYNFVNALNDLSPTSVLKRGYSIVYLDGKVIKNANEVKTDSTLNIKLAKGTIDTKVINIKGEE